MNKIYFMIVLIIIVGSILYIATNIVTHKNIVTITDPLAEINSTTVEAGQIWVYESKNPFITSSSTYYVIEVKQEYIKYCNVIDGKYNIEKWRSSSISLFKTGSRRVK